MSHATATKTAAKKPAKKKVSAFSTRKVDPAYYWMVVPAAIIFAFFLYLPFLDGVKYSFTNSQGYGPTPSPCWSSATCSSTSS